MNKITKDILKQIYAPRPADAHKYHYGLLLVVGGGEFYTGSPALAAMAAFRAGVDMVQVLAPKRAADIIASFSPNLAAYPLKNPIFSKEELPIVLSFVSSAQEVAHEKRAIVLGGGMGRSNETKQALNEFFQQADIKMVVDADALYALAENPFALKDKPVVLTPHAYEFFVLSGKKVAGLPLEEKARIVQEQAAKMGLTILLKGAIDIISNGEQTLFDETGTAYMTVGGTGDTLAGICGALLAMGIEPFLAAQAASFINGKAGELASKRLGASMLATDLIEDIAQVIKF